MVHSVGGEMDDDAAQRFLLGRVVERVQKRLVEPLLVHDFTGEPEELRGGCVVALTAGNVGSVSSGKSYSSSSAITRTYSSGSLEASARARTASSPNG